MRITGGIRPVVVALAAATLSAVAAGLVLMAPIAAAVADTDDFEFESFHSVIELAIGDDRRSIATVTETIVAVFPEFDQNRGVVRAIPLRDQGFDLDVEVVSVTDADGVPVAWERDDEGGFAVLALGTDEYVHGRTTYVIEYALRDVIRHFDDSGGDEFTWDINGDGWGQPFGSVSADVTVAPELAVSLAGEFVCYAGFEEIREPCTIERDGATFLASAGPLAPFRTLTVSIGFDRGVVVQPPRTQDSWIVTVVPWALFWLSLGLLVTAIVVRAVRWRDPARRRAIIAEFAPPLPRDLLLDGEVLGRQAPVFAAVVIDLAVRGIIRIVDLDALTEADERYGIELVNAAAATPAETGILEALFGGPLEPGAIVRPGEISAAAGAAVHARLAAAPAASIMNGLRRRASARWARALRAASLVVAIAGAGPFVWMIGFDLELAHVVLLGIGVIAMTIATWAVTSPPTLLTRTGADRRDHLLGIREYLTVAEQDRFRMLQSPDGATRVARALGVEAGEQAGGAPDGATIVKLNERLLPWAVLWGVEDEWSRVLVTGAAAAGVASSAAVLGITNPSVLAWASSSSARMAPVTASGGSSWSGSGGSSFSSSSFGGGFAGGGGGGGGGGGR
jgi:uncharacterized membrane protein YgcG